MRARHRRLVTDQLAHRIVSQRVVIVLVLVPAEHPGHPLPQQAEHRMIEAPGSRRSPIAAANRSVNRTRSSNCRTGNNPASLVSGAADTSI